MANTNLAAAKKNKNDEFYTRLEDIENELEHYEMHFKDKIVFCNCDDATWSNFWKYFHVHFGQLGLKKLVAVGYNAGGAAYKAEYDGGNDEDIAAYVRTDLTGNGDFRSEESIECLKEADIVVTNPPFSLFREYVAQLMEYNKKFLIIGNINAITCKNVFPLLKDGKIWPGFSFNKTMEFMIPDEAEIKGKGFIDENGQKHVFIGGICWFTNLYITKHYKPLNLTKSYTPEEYPKYDNYDAINVDRVAYIPKDYDGVMGVPITFMDKYNPEQFEIVGLIAGNIKGLADITSKSGKDGPYLNGKLKYGRILIKRKPAQFEILGKSDDFAGAVVINNKLKKNPGRFYVNGQRKYDRILIKRNPDFVDE